MKLLKIYIHNSEILRVQFIDGSHQIPKVIIVLTERNTHKSDNHLNLDNLKKYKDYMNLDKRFYSFNLYARDIRKIHFDMDPSLLHSTFIERSIEKIEREINYERTKSTN